jgi:hypothetical protein
VHPDIQVSDFSCQVAKLVDTIDAFKRKVDRIVQAREPVALGVIATIRTNVAAERAGIEKEIAIYRELAPYADNPRLDELIELRASSLLAGLDLVLASLQPRPGVPE